MSAYPTMRQAKIDNIHMKLGAFAACAAIQNGLGLFNLNHYAEDLFCEILNALKGWHLSNVNRETLNCPGIDLIDKEQKIIVQVTSDRRVSKLKDTLSKVQVPKYEGYTFYFLCFNIVPPPVEDWAQTPFDNTDTQVCSFCVENVITIETIVKWVSDPAMDDKTLDCVWNALARYVDGVQPQADLNGEKFKDWIKVSCDAWKRFFTLKNCDSVPLLNQKLNPYCSANWGIIDLSASILTVKGNNLSDRYLVELLDKLGVVCDTFAMTSFVCSHEDLLAVQKNAEDGCNLIKEVLTHLAYLENVNSKDAESLFMQYVSCG